MLVSKAMREKFKVNTFWELFHEANEQGPPKPADYKPGKLFGVEIEVEGDRLPEVFGWDTHAEGSLRGNAKEYVTCGPVSRDALASLLDDLNGAFKAAGSRIRDSHRASVHIHRNVRDRTMLQILRMIIRYVSFEPILLSACGPLRNGNLFCMSAYDTGDIAEWLRTFFKHHGRRDSIALMALHRGKYSALNVDPLTKFGSLEFRCFPATVKKQDILKFTDWIEGVIAFEENLSAIEEIELLYRIGEVEAQKIFGPDTPANVGSLMKFGLEQAWDLAVLFHEELEV